MFMFLITRRDAYPYASMLYIEPRSFNTPHGRLRIAVPTMFMFLITGRDAYPYASMLYIEPRSFNTPHGRLRIAVPTKSKTPHLFRVNFKLVGSAARTPWQAEANSLATRNAS